LPASPNPEDGRDGIINYSEWSVPLGRRFRALKLWSLLRARWLKAST
jgi:aromatic-L-amino-acid decarboxylase